MKIENSDNQNFRGIVDKRIDESFTYISPKKTSSGTGLSWISKEQYLRNDITCNFLNCDSCKIISQVFKSSYILCGDSCFVCTRNIPFCLATPSPSWSAISFVSTYTLHHLNPEKQFLGLKDAIYPFIEKHWPKLCGDRLFEIGNWHKQIRESISHSQLFQSGVEKLGRTGYWQLEKNIDPWEEQRPMHGVNQVNYGPLFINGVLQRDPETLSSKRNDNIEFKGNQLLLDYNNSNNNNEDDEIIITIPDIETILEYLEVIELNDTDFKNIVILETIYKYVQYNSGPKFFDRLKQLIFQTEKSICYFSNELFIETFLDRDNSTNLEIHQNKIISKAVQWYINHFNQLSKVNKRKYKIILITNNESLIKI